MPPKLFSYDCASCSRIFPAALLGPAAPERVSVLAIMAEKYFQNDWSLSGGGLALVWCGGRDG